MFLPIGDTPNLPRTPWLTWLLIAVNVAIHLWTVPLAFRAANPVHPELQEYRAALATERGVLVDAVSAGDLLRFVHGFKPAAPELRDAVTSMFLHGGWMHLAGNMLFLYIFGDNVEHRLGRGRFLAAYLATGFAAIAGDWFLRQGSAIPSVGASGAISGVLGFYFAWFPRNRVRVWAFLFPFYIGILELSARFVLGAYLVVDNLLPALFASGSGGVAHGAHIGGFLAGWAIAAAAPRLGRRPRRSGVDARDPNPTERFHLLVADGKIREAAGLLHQLGPSRSPGLAAELDLARRAEAAGELELALGVYRRAASVHASRPGVASAHLGAARVLLALDAPTVAYQELASAAPLVTLPDERAEWEALVRILRSRTSHVPRAFRI